jgi:prolipoprotein diacylglyceryltransferase
VLAVIRLDFDPAFRLLGQSVRWETVGLAAAVLATLVLAALGAGRLENRLEAAGGWARLRRDDLILIAFGAVPGAVVGGRLGYGLLHLDYYLANPAGLLDPGQGSLELSLAVVFGTLSAISVARLLRAPVGPWLEVASLPVVVGLGLGKLAMALGGAGQGQYSDAAWATQYVRPGPWISANAALPALPSQLIEGCLVLLAAALLAGLPVLLRLRLERWRALVRPILRPDPGRPVLGGSDLFLLALGLWAAARFLAVFTWRDAGLVGPLRAEHFLLAGLVGGCLIVPHWPALVRAGRARWAQRQARITAGR